MTRDVAELAKRVQRLENLVLQLVESVGSLSKEGDTLDVSKCRICENIVCSYSCPMERTFRLVRDIQDEQDSI